MHIFFTIAAGIFGLIVGSFLNVVILRMNTGKGLGGRSVCLSCNAKLGWKELIPLVSFIIQKGRCKHCHSKISWQYPIVEGLTALLFASVVWNIHGATHIILWLIAVSLGMVIAVYDIYHKMIPVKPLIALAVVALVMGLHILAAVLVALPFLAIWFISLGKWIGFGDIELMAIIGLALGTAKGYSAVILGFWVACLVILPIVFYLKRKGKKYDAHIPFGPFLLVGMYLVGVWGLNIVGFVSKMVH
jgi:prepilin signal peptidase PulO-like enzyme (type II secretory pathway)